MKGLLEITLALLTICLNVASVEGGSNYCPTKYTVRKLRYRLIRYRCGWRWWWRKRWCTRRKCEYYVETRTNYHVCCPGWKGCNCNIPICVPACENGGVCLAPGSCSCPDGYRGGYCQTKYCSARTDCYPGTCHTRTSLGPTCRCTAGFDGSNCINILDGPDFARCSAQLIDLKQGIFSGTCGPPGQPEDYTYYTNKRDPTEVKIDLETVYTYPGDVPLKPDYLPRSKVGNVESYAIARLIDQAGQVIPDSEERLVCDTRPNNDNPYAAAECKSKRFSWKHAIGHNYQMEIIMYGVSGGYKVINNPLTLQQDTKYYVGTPSNQTVLIIFDILDPHHCHTMPDTNCSAEDPPILNQEFTRSPDISLDFYGWDDDGTGLDLFWYRVHKMGLNSDGLMELSGEPLLNGTQDVVDITPDNAVITLTLPEPGRYSVVLTVSDRAGNTQNARSLITYDNTNTLAQRPDTSASIVGAVEGPYYNWLTSYESTGPTSMTVTWAGVFHNPVHVTKNYLIGAELLNNRENPDWGYEDTFGNLTTSPTPHEDGVTNFKFAYAVDQIGGKSARQHPPDLEEVTLATSHVISHTISDGYTVLLFVEASDCVGFNLTVATPVHVDSSPPLIFGEAEFKKDFMSNSSVDMPYTSRFLVPASDQHSGIGEVEYIITVASGSRANEVVGRDVSRNYRIDNVDSNYCLQTGNCTCAKIGDCFPSPVPVDVNNCWFRDFLSETLSISYIVRNGALLNVSGDPVQFGPLGSVFGLNECVVIEDGDKQYYVAYPKTTFVLNSLTPETTYTLLIFVNYGDQKSEGKELQATTAVYYPCPPGKRCESGLTGGEIAGIVIGVLLLLLLVVIALFLLVRWRRHEPLVPQRVRTIRQNLNNLRHTFMAKGGVSGNEYKVEDTTVTNNVPSGVLNVAYKGLAGTEDDIYTYGDLETDPNASWKYSQDKLTILELISSGRFAEVRKASLLDKNGQQDLAAKMLKAGASSDDQLLMRAKMNFLATSVPVHENIAMLVGAVPTDNPIILMEYCQMTLKDWLKALNKDRITEEVEDNMINFSMHIANGMEHLHLNHIVHRRLGVRNVMLKQVNGRYIAKLIGFGPMKNEVQGSSDDSSKEKIPFKWMAPEQIGGKKEQRRVYNEKTDVWTYGITLWEIFSVGQSPYKDYKHGDMQELHASETRLEKPKHCPDDLYKDIMIPSWSQYPANRPTFLVICNDLNKLFGNDHDGYYYSEQDHEGYGRLHGKPEDHHNKNYGNNLYG